jgi:hypothetical protein
MARIERDAAIERWEDEGGRALPPEESLSAGPGDLTGSDPEEGGSLAAGPQARPARERPTSSLS